MTDPPLAGARIVVTRPPGTEVRLVSELEALGADVAVVPLVDVREADSRALDAAFEEERDWIVFTSANGVRAVGERLHRAGRARFAAVGPATAAALRDVGVEPAFVPDRFAADAISDGLGKLAGARVLLPQADIADPALADELRARSAVVEALVAYRTVAIEPDERGLEALRGADVILLASGSAARALASVSLPLERALVACIGPKTAREAAVAGLQVRLVAEEATVDGMIRALVSHFGER